MFPLQEVLWIPFCRDQCECQEEREPSLMILMTHLKSGKDKELVNLLENLKSFFTDPGYKLDIN